jgi:glycosyltransferase involved in cell wall biosynthesis
VVVPAHNEAQLLPGCLHALRAAAAAAPVATEIIVVADACEDQTETLARQLGPENGCATVLAIGAGNVGIARAAGMRAACRTGSQGLWLLSTDADTVVPRDWITRHLAHAARGAQLVAGTVAPADWQGWPPALVPLYRRGYQHQVTAGGHGHIHGANLGILAGPYLALGGFQPRKTGEDVALVHAARAAGLRVTAALDLPVRTSTRPSARAPAGFSAHLHSLRKDLAADGPLPLTSPAAS